MLALHGGDGCLGVAQRWNALLTLLVHNKTHSDKRGANQRTNKSKQDADVLPAAIVVKS